MIEYKHIAFEAYQIYLKKGPDSNAEENWAEAEESLKIFPKKTIIRPDYAYRTICSYTNYEECWEHSL